MFLKPVLQSVHPCDVILAGVAEIGAHGGNDLVFAVHDQKTWLLVLSQPRTTQAKHSDWMFLSP